MKKLVGLLSATFITLASGVVDAGEDVITITRGGDNNSLLIAQIVPFSELDGSVDFREEKNGIRLGAYDNSAQPGDRYYFTCFAPISSGEYPVLRDAIDGAVITLKLKSVDDICMLTP